MPRPGTSLVLPPLTLPPNQMSSNPSSPRDSEPSSADSDPIRTPLDCTYETCDPIIISDPLERLDVVIPNHHITGRSLSEGSSHSGSMHKLSHDRWRAARKLKDNNTKFHRGSSISSLFSNLHIHFEQPRPHNGTDAARFSSQFPEGHQLNADFVKTYQLQDELGCGGYGFVMTAFDHVQRQEVAVKFIVKAKVPDHAWMEDPAYGKLPTEVVLLTCINHENIVKCLGLFEDDLYFYMVQELHGSPWEKDHKFDSEPVVSGKCSSSSSMSLPTLSPSTSETSLPISEPTTPPKLFLPLDPLIDGNSLDDCLSHGLETHKPPGASPEIARRPSHDLFECIEQSENKRLTEDQARYVFAQVADAVEYLDSLGIVHRDIKDENVVIDKNLKIKLIDFGSAVAVDPTSSRPTYSMFYGTAAYASSEILLKQEYKAAPAEIWTIGVLLSYLLGGISPFPTIRDAVDGRICLPEDVVLSDEAMDLMRRCLTPDPDARATIAEVKAHPWLRQCVDKI